MSPDERDEPFLDDEEEEPRSLISSLWFRLALVVAAVGVIGVIVVPRALDWINPASTIGSMKPVAAVAPPTAPAAPSDRSVVNLSPTAPATGSPSAPAPSSGPGASASSSTSAEPATTSPVATAAPAVAKVEESKPATATPVTPAPSPAPSVAAPTTPSRTAVAPREAEPRARSSARSTASGDYWVQVAAFHEPKGAARLATQLRGQNFSVTESTATLPVSTGKSTGASAPAKAASRYDVLVTGASPAEITPKLTSGDLSAEAMGNDVIVKPSLPLAAATNLSKSLAAAGYKVQVRRAHGSEAEQAAGGRAGDAAGGKAAGNDPASPVYRVRVGPFPDRATAAATLQELEAKGYKPFIAKGQP
jgi:cell division protein FtsN